MLQELVEENRCSPSREQPFMVSTVQQRNPVPQHLTCFYMFFYIMHAFKCSRRCWRSDRRGDRRDEGLTILSFTVFPWSFALCINGSSKVSVGRKGVKGKQSIHSFFSLKRCFRLHPSSPLYFQEPFGKMYLNKDRRSARACMLIVEPVPCVLHLE